MINIYPEIGKSVSEILDNYFKSHFIKMCPNISVSTSHTELSCIGRHSDILVIAINRFEFVIFARRNNRRVSLKFLCNDHIATELKPTEEISDGSFIVHYRPRDHM